MELRNSMSKTDLDATCMRMKDDHMQNGQLKPRYNLQASSNNHFIVNYTLAQTTADTTTLINHLEEYQESFDEHPETLTADTGYGSEQNYTYLEDQNIEAFVKYSYFDKEQKQHNKPFNPFHLNELHYNIEQGGVAHRKQRYWDIEAIFGNIRHNINFKRFMFRGIDKGNIEIGLVAMTHNLKNVALAS